MNNMLGVFNWQLTMVGFPPNPPSLLTPIHKGGGIRPETASLCGDPYEWVSGGWAGKEEIPLWYLNSHRDHLNYHCGECKSHCMRPA